MESILYAQVPDNIVVIRVCGKGNHLNSLALREIFNLTSTPERSPRYILDLEKCDSMDSTFMGMIASMAARQERLTGTQMAAVNLNDHVRELLDVLGLKYLLDMRNRREPSARIEIADQEGAFIEMPSPKVDKLERTLMMIEAHEKLIDIDTENEIKFRGVVQTLRECVDRSRGGN